MIKCPICESTHTKRLTFDGKVFLECSNCKLLWHIKEPTLDYTTSYYKSSNPTNKVSASKQVLYRDMLHEAKLRHHKIHRVLDVGSGPGEFLEFAKKQGWEAAGIEPVEGLVEKSRERGHTVYRGTLTELPEEAGKFDLITYWDVFMMVEHPQKEMRLVMERLAPGGCVFMRTRQHAVVRFMDFVWKHGGKKLIRRNPAVYHPYNYRPETLHLLFNRLGMNHIVKGGRLTAGDPYGFGKRLTIVNMTKKLISAVAHIMEVLSANRLILSPTIVVWATREKDCLK